MEHVCKIHGLPESYVIDPFYEDIHGKVIWQWMCQECYHDSCMDI